MKQRSIVPTSAIELAQYKSINNKSKVVRVGNNTEIFINKRGSLTIRKVGRSGGLNAKAFALKACKGKGVTCVRTVLPKKHTRKATV